MLSISPSRAVPKIGSEHNLILRKAILVHSAAARWQHGRSQRRLGGLEFAAVRNPCHYVIRRPRHVARDDFMQ